ncbi:hypothetical protein C2845_PM05G23360 [Panicum miliaceum]|uniref:Subtilisin-like protease SBT1.7 n=1 Tax=Panicum miliaceum TaxID=4540 RepID=A0A3L6T1B3_PANMI|nr:hypothetical protein C2845_PM05G23360 [Panicum miliaceum]
MGPPPALVASSPRSPLPAQPLHAQATGATTGPPLPLPASSPGSPLPAQQTPLHGQATAAPMETPPPAPPAPLPQLARPTPPPYTAEGIFRDFSCRRAALIRALTTGYVPKVLALPLTVCSIVRCADEKTFSRECNAGTETLYLYGNSDGSWELRPPKLLIPTGQPDPRMLGVKLVRGDMKHAKWLRHIAMHCDAWLIRISFFLGANLGTQARTFLIINYCFFLSTTQRLCAMINSLQTVHEKVVASDTYHHICHLEKKAAHRLWHESFLRGSGGGGRRRVRHSYTSVLSGFAARLTDGELAAVSRKPGFVRAFPERRVQLMTTRTPAFLELEPDRGVWNATSYGEGAIIGFLDTGIDEKHPSFHDQGMPPPPARWKGACQPPVRCNNKLIGVASFVGDNTTTDDVGHGTHTTGTAAGRFVEGASAFGPRCRRRHRGRDGTRRAPGRVQGCFESDLLAGMDAAVKDGVDVLSVSLGGVSTPLDKDPIAIGAFAAASKGVLVVCAGGNSGPLLSTLSNEAPWILTVAAGSVDRSFRATVRLGDGEMFEGESLTQDKHFSSMVYPLYYSQGMNYCDFFDANITGMMVVCDTETPVPPMSSIEAVREAGGVGVVFINEPDFGYTIVLEKYYNLPMSQVTAVDGTKIMGYAMKGSSRTNHTATIMFNSTVVGVKPAPIVAAFSSRGPSVASPGVLKPDIMAPGLNILAAWPSLVPVEGPESYSFNIISGTSMATPHVTGIVALVKKAHPDWSAAAIKSAIMTSSSAVDNEGNQIMDEEHQTASSYAVGAGHVVPAKAVDPGLVYDIGVRDYAGYICKLLGEAALKAIAGSAT